MIHYKYRTQMIISRIWGCTMRSWSCCSSLPDCVGYRSLTRKPGPKELVIKSRLLYGAAWDIMGEMNMRGEVPFE